MHEQILILPRFNRFNVQMSKQAYMAFSQLIYMIERLLASWQASREGHAEGVEGGVWQTKGATRRCRDSATAFTQAGGHGRGGDSKVGR